MRRKVLVVGGCLFVVVAGLLVLDLSRQQPVSVARASSGNLTVEANPRSVRIGEDIVFKLTVTGPATYDSCDSVVFWLTNSEGRKVGATGSSCPPPLPELRTVAPGQRMTFARTFGTTGAVAGTYQVHGTFLQSVIGPGQYLPPENLPVLTVEFRK
jgi:hypothetical protein